MYIWRIDIICLTIEGAYMNNPDKEFLAAEDMIFKSEHKPIQRIYIDLEYMQDLRFGAMLNMLKVKEELSYIIHNIGKYNSRYDRGLCKYFKALKIDEDRIDRVLHRQLAVDKVCVTSPFTSIYYYLYKIVVAASNHIKAMEEHPKAIEIVINCSDVQYPEILQEKLCSTLSEQLGVVARFTQTKRYSLSSNEYLSYDLLMLVDYGDFVKQHAQTLIGSGKFSDIRVVAQPYIEDEILTKIDDPEYTLAYTEKSLGVYCEFSYLRSNILIDKL